MKKLLPLFSVFSLILISTPALAVEPVRLGLGGHFIGYVNMVDQDERAPNAAHKIDILRDTEVAFTGETILSNGTIIGAEIEAEAQTDDNFEIDKSFIFFKTRYGLFEFGTNDGAVYQLQVAAPAADENIDGIRQRVQPINYTVAGLNATLVNQIRSDGFDYDNRLANGSDKLVYISPVVKGTQIAISYAPELSDTSRALDGNAIDDQEGNLGDVFEAAWRYERAFSDEFKAILGAGYTMSALEKKNDGVAPAPVGSFRDDFKEWNIAADFDIAKFGLGAAYTENNSGLQGSNDVKSWAVGADYQVNDPIRVGLSYFNQTRELGSLGSNADLEIGRVTLGAVYDFGPGISFRGAIQHSEMDVPASAGPQDISGTALLLGTQIDF